MKNHVKLCGKKKTAGIKYKLYSDYWIATWSREDLCIKVTVVILLVYKEWLYTLGDNIFLNDHFADVVLRNITSLIKKKPCWKFQINGLKEKKFFVRVLTFLDRKCMYLLYGQYTEIPSHQGNL